MATTQNTMTFEQYDSIDLRDLLEAEQDARAEGREEAADALARRRSEIATREDGSDARYVCTTCAGNEVDETPLREHKSVQKYALVCEDCDEIVGVRLDTSAGETVKGVREIEVSL